MQTESDIEEKMISTEFKTRRTLLRIGALLIALSLPLTFAIERFSKPVSEEMAAEQFYENQPLVSTSPWVETARVPSPDSNVEAVLISFNLTPPESFPLSCLFLVERGQTVKAEPPYQRYWTRDFVERLHRRSPFIAFDARDISVRWRGSRNIEIAGRVGKILAKAAAKELQVRDHRDEINIDLGRPAGA